MDVADGESRRRLGGTRAGVGRIAFFVSRTDWSEISAGQCLLQMGKKICSGKRSGIFFAEQKNVFLLFSPNFSNIHFAAKTV